MKTLPKGRSPKVLVVDVGGTHIKLLAMGQTVPIKIASGPTMTAQRMVPFGRTRVSPAATLSHHSGTP